MVFLGPMQDGVGDLVDQGLEHLGTCRFSRDDHDPAVGSVKPTTGCDRIPLTARAEINTAHHAGAETKCNVPQNLHAALEGFIGFDILRDGCRFRERSTGLARQGIGLAAGKTGQWSESHQHRPLVVRLAAHLRSVDDHGRQDGECPLASADLPAGPLPSRIGGNCGRTWALHLNQDLVSEREPPDGEGTTAGQLGQHRLPVLATLQALYGLGEKALRLLDLLLAVKSRLLKWYGVHGASSTTSRAGLWR